MTRDDIIEMAQKAGLLRFGYGWTEPHRCGMTEVEGFFNLVAAHEREACAQLCEDLWEDDGTAWDCAVAIESRGNK